MELDEVMRTTFTCRDFTDQQVEDSDIEEIIELARFAPSGGNRQPNRVVVVREPGTKAVLRDCATPPLRVYMEQVGAGEAPWNTINPTTVDAEALLAETGPIDFLQFLENAPVLLCIGADLSEIASFDVTLDRVGVISGASIYPFAWNILLAARSRGMGGALTTFSTYGEPRAQEVLGFPPHVALAAVMPLGYPRKQLTKLSRKPVADIVRYERWTD